MNSELESTPTKYSVILRTHSGANVHMGTRFVSASKTELIYRCLNSLVKALNFSDADIEFVVIDDHSSPECLAGIERLLSVCKHPTKLIPLENTGNGASLLCSYEYGRDHGRDVIYFVEDDYLHYPSAIIEMFETYHDFKKNLGGKEVAIHPADDPKDYLPHAIPLSRIVLGRKRHWRTNFWTTGTLLIHSSMLVAHWDKFMAFTHYGTPGVSEDTTINKIWKEGHVTLFTPIPSVAIHMQFSEDIPAFTDWKILWDQNRVE